MVIRYSLILVSFFILSFQQSCKKNERPPVVACTAVRPHDGLIKCKSRRVNPAVGPVYYKNQYHEFTTTGPNRQCCVPDVTDSNGNLLISGIPYAFQIIYSARDSSVTIGGGICPGSIVPVFIRKPENNWYDSCNGILYLDYYWISGSQWYMCDTCYF
jgi:hypothetical protein